MFGYIRPVQSELKVRELEQFKACYCSLCRTLGEKYGIGSRFILNYDFVFLAMLLWSPDEKTEYEKGSCPLHPVKGKQVCPNNEVLERCAGYSLILAYWKMRDSVQDDTFFKAQAARAASVGIKLPYKKAEKAYPQFCEAVKTELRELSDLENANESSMDKAADRFARILKAAADGDEGSADNRAKQQILYHMGRWIYIIDAVNDIADDQKTGSYNPVAARYGITDGVISDEIKEELKITLTHSENMITSAYELLPENHWAGIIRNILYLGMPFVRESVFDGTFQNTKERLPK